MFSRMHHRLACFDSLRTGRAPRALVAALLLFASACAAEVAPERPEPPAPAEPRPESHLYSREFLFVGDRAGVPLAVPFAFSSLKSNGELERSARGWLAYGAEWDAFLDETWSAPAIGGVWRVLPRGDFRVVAGLGSREIEALVFRRGERLLRVQPEILRSTWSPRDEVQYRIYEGRLELAGQLTRGSVVEAYRVLPAAEHEIPAGAVDWMYLTDGDGVHLLLAEALAPPDTPDNTFGWTVLPDLEAAWDNAEIRWLEMRPIEQARRDVPVSWSFRIPGARIEGEVATLGFDLQLGPDRPGRRSVLLRHNVEGWAELDERRYRVFGFVSHSQD
jgi:hypothetical protein